MGRVVGLVLALGCAAGSAAPAPVAPSPSSAAPSVATSPVRAPEASAAPGGILEGSCEPSALVRKDGVWIVGDNETSGHLFAYDAAMKPVPAPPLQRDVEDIEALVLAGDDLLVVGSHSRNKHAEVKPNRRVVSGLAVGAVAVDFGACPACVAAEPFAPNAGGLNIEGAAWVDGGLVVGLRSPLSAAKASLLRVDVASRPGTVTEVLPLDLAGFGVRELTPFRGGLLVVAGPAADADSPHSLWFLPHLGAQPQRLPVELPPSTEGLWPVDDTHLRYVIDGSGKNGVCDKPGRWGDLTIPSAG